MSLRTVSYTHLDVYKRQEYGYLGGGEDNWGPTGNYNYDEDYNQVYGDVVVDKTVETDNLPKVKGVSALNLGLPDANNQFRGIYVVTVQSLSLIHISKWVFVLFSVEPSFGQSCRLEQVCQ